MKNKHLIKNSIMKKLLCLVMSVALLLGATGCNMNNTGKGAAIGAGGGAAVGAGLGAIRKNNSHKSRVPRLRPLPTRTTSRQSKSLSMQESFSAPERATSAKLRKMLSAILLPRSSRTRSPTSPSMDTPTIPAHVQLTNVSLKSVHKQ